MKPTASPLFAVLVASLCLFGTIQTAGAQSGGSSSVGASGGDTSQAVPPGLEAGTPSPAITRPEDVKIYVPYDDRITGRVSIPDEKLAVVVQPEGRDWRAYRMKGLLWGGAAIILLTLVALAVFFLWRGRIRIESGWSGRWIPRFNGFERFVHWTTAISFIVLALSGLIIIFGRFVLIPLVGHSANTVASDWSKYLHNFSGPVFALGVVLMLVMWIKDNIPNRQDLVWLRQAGGIMGGKSPHPETGRFNAGQKGIFWAVVLGGIALTVSGVMLMMPFAWTGIGGMQTAHVVHSVLAALMIAVILAHIYIGTVGMEGAFHAMGRGEVDENWAREHHSGWYNAYRGSALPEGRPAPSRRDMRWWHRPPEEHPPEPGHGAQQGAE